MEFNVEITGLNELVAKLQQAPELATPILRRAVADSWKILSKNTNVRTVPFKTGFLLQSFGGSINGLTAIWGPDHAHETTYSRFVEFGTAPHVIEAKNKKVLANKATGQIFGKRVNHPGTKPNPYMERIVDASRDQINETFGTALSQITAALASK